MKAYPARGWSADRIRVRYEAESRRSGSTSEYHLQSEPADSLGPHHLSSRMRPGVLVPLQANGSRQRRRRSASAACRPRLPPPGIRIRRLVPDIPPQCAINYPHSRLRRFQSVADLRSYISLVGFIQQRFRRRARAEFISLIPIVPGGLRQPLFKAFSCLIRRRFLVTRCSVGSRTREHTSALIADRCPGAAQ